MFKRNFNRTAFIKARLAQSAEHRATILKVVGSNTQYFKLVRTSFNLSRMNWHVTSFQYFKYFDFFLLFAPLVHRWSRQGVYRYIHVSVDFL